MPTISLQDRAPLQRTRKLADGRIAAVARFARSGVYQYTGAELGRPHLSTVNVYRPESEVFSEDAMASFAHKTLTLDHPGENVTAQNWKRVAVGYTEGRVARDGGFVEIPLMVADAEAVAAIDSGAASELSAGYSCELIWEDGVAPSGETYQAKQVRIRGDHIAIVAKGRAGSSCRIGDSAMLTDVEQAELGTHVAYERNRHETSQAYRGADAAPWTDAMADAASQRFLARKSDTRSVTGDRTAWSDAQTVLDKARTQHSYEKSVAYLNAWRKGN